MKSMVTLALLLLILPLVDVFAQKPIRPTPSSSVSDSTSAAHTIFGDLKVDESKVAGIKPATFQIVLYTLTGQPIGRQSASNNGRYYFHNVPNGDYAIVVESEGAEVARIPLRIEASVKTEFRQNIELEWRGKNIEEKPAKPGTISASNVYSRSNENQKLFDKAQEAIAKMDNKQAVTLLDKIVKADANDYQAWASLGAVYSSENKHGESEKAFRRALAAKPDFKMAILNLGRAQMAQKNFEGAIETLTKAVEADPKSAEANFLLGESYLQIKKGSKAVGYLNESVKLDPIGMADAHLRLGALYRAAGMKDKAVAEFEQFLAKRPDYPDKERLRQYISENKSK